MCGLCTHMSHEVARAVWSAPDSILRVETHPNACNGNYTLVGTVVCLLLPSPILATTAPALLQVSLQLGEYFLTPGPLHWLLLLPTAHFLTAFSCTFLPAPLILLGCLQVPGSPPRPSEVTFLYHSLLSCPSKLLSALSFHQCLL